MCHYAVMILSMILGQYPMKVEAPIQFEEAKSLAQAQDRNILMVFSGTDWCKPCIQLKNEILTTSEFQNFASEHIIQLNLDFPYSKKNQLDDDQKKHNEKLAETYNPEGAFPKILILNAQGDIIGTLHYSKGATPECFIGLIKEMI